MRIEITELPRIAGLLSVEKTPHFVVLPYEPFVLWVARAPQVSTPDVAAVLDTHGEHQFIVILYEEYRKYLGHVEVAGRIDEVHYLARHEDVSAAVSHGALRSGTDHYLIQGYLERREARLPAADDGSGQTANGLRGSA
jgi:hypothetical protein